jgi:hypothetical protein
MQRIDDLSKQVDALQKQQSATQPALPAAGGYQCAVPAVRHLLRRPLWPKRRQPPEPRFEQFLKGFYGTLDVSSGRYDQGHQRAYGV